MSRLKKVEFECEVITPMFLGGADGNQAELRAPSVRGAMRFWFRAMMGGRGYNDSKKLFIEEQRVFGSAEHGGSVSIKVPFKEMGTQKAEIYTKDRDGRVVQNGKSYLWYSTTLGNNDKSYIKPNEKFNIVLSSLNDHDLRLAAQSFVLLSYFGGLGSRSRRFGGSFQIISMSSAIDVEYQLERLLQVLKESELTLSNRPEFNSLNSDFVRVWKVNNGFETWEKAVESIGTAFKKFRLRNGVNDERNGDYHKMKNFISKSVTPTNIDRVRFGLPLSFQFRSLPRNKNRATINVANRDKTINRKASPILFSLVKENNKYYPIITTFDSMFLPKEASIQIGNQSINASSKDIVANFVSSLEDNTILIFGGK